MNCFVEVHKIQMDAAFDKYLKKSVIQVPARGFYGNAMDGTPEAIKTCPCPDNGPCIEVSGNIQSPKCTECPEGRMGFRCEKCEDGYFGDPR